MRNHIPTVLVVDDRERAKACGAADFLEKPFTTGTLLAAVCLADDSSH